jgi:RNA-directed DNA polymerase
VAPDPAEQRGARVESELEEGNMNFTPMKKDRSTKLLEVAERAKNPNLQLRALANLIDEEGLTLAFKRLQANAVAGVDGVRKAEYEKDLENNIKALYERMRAWQWRHQPVKRVYIPKGRGKTRPIGISCTEDKIVQGALYEVLKTIYEPVFHRDSYGFRPGRSQHDATRRLNGVLDSGGARWILEFDIESFFDSIDRKMLQEMLWVRVADKSLKRLVGKCLHVGILDGYEYSEPVEGTVQGSVLSPILGNIYLHHVLDDWFEREVRPRMRGKAHLIRYADDGVLAFERRDDAEKVLKVLHARFAKYGLRLHPDKTRLIRFTRPDEPGGGETRETFDFLSFTYFWRRTRTGRWRPGVRTHKASLRRFVMNVADWCRSQRHLPVKEQHAALCQRINGHFNYFGVNGNVRALKRVTRIVERIWRKWLRRRSQRTRITWHRFKNVILTAFPLPDPKIRVQIW